MLSHDKFQSAKGGDDTTQRDTLTGGLDTSMLDTTQMMHSQLDDSRLEDSQIMNANDMSMTSDATTSAMYSSLMEEKKESVPPVINAKTEKKQGSAMDKKSAKNEEK